MVLAIPPFKFSTPTATIQYFLGTYMQPVNLAERRVRISGALETACLQSGFATDEMNSASALDCPISRIASHRRMLPREQALALSQLHILLLHHQAQHACATVRAHLDSLTMAPSRSGQS